MTLDRATIKLVFGLLIFMFSLALAYFTASYVRSERIFDYWTTLVISAAAFIIVGIVVFEVFPVSLGFLFSADVLILHLLIENFGDISDIVKTFVIGIVLVLLYIFAWYNMRDPDIQIPPPPPQATIQ